jgi:F-type H+-transporting ATPase subunit c
MKKLNFVLGVGMAFLMPTLAFAQDDVATGRPYYAIAKGFAIGLAALGCALGQGRIVGTAVDGISRNPGASGQIFTPMLLGVAFVETLLIFTLFLSGIAA